MKLLGVRNDTHVIASMGRHDYIQKDELVADGGIPGTISYAGYSKFWGTSTWFEVLQTFGELYTDYQCNYRDRKFGIWNLEDVRILTEDEYPDTDSLEWRVEQAVWGTRGIDGDQPLKYVHLKDCETSHLQAILDNV